MWANYTNVVISDLPGASALLHVAALQIFILEIMQFIYFWDRSAVGYAFCDPFMSRGGCCVINPLSSGPRRHTNHQCFGLVLL